MAKIHVDQGHGYPDNRGGVSGLNEGENNFHLGNAIGKALERSGHEVTYSRSTIHQDPSLSARCAMGAGKDLYLSIHSNAINNASVSGVEIYDSTEKQNYEFAKKLSSVIAGAQGIPDRKVRYRGQESEWDVTYAPRPWTLNYYAVLRLNQAKSAMLVEFFYHTNYSDIEKYRKNRATLINHFVQAINERYGGSAMSETKIMYERRTNVEQMKQWAINRKADPLFVELAPIFYEISASNNVDPAVVYTQSAHETNFMKFGGVIDKSFKNPCGMKTKDGGGNYEKEAHQRFKSWEEGITAQVHHLALYYGHKDYPKANSPDPRHFASIHGKAKTVEQLTGNWATNPNYAKEILKFMDELQKTKVDTVSVGDTELHVEIDTCVCYAQDGDLPNAIALVNALGQGTVLVKGDPWFSARVIIQVGGHEIKGATIKIVGQNRRETLKKVGEFIKSLT